MPRVLHLFNIFGAVTERSQFNVVRGLAERGFAPTCGYETLAAEAPVVDWPLVQLRRVMVAPTDDVPGQMEEVAAKVDDPARAALLEQPFDLVHGHFGPRILQAAAWFKKGERPSPLPPGAHSEGREGRATASTRRVPVVVSIYGYDASRLLRDETWAARYRWAAEHGAIFVTLSQANFDKLRGLGVPAENLRLIHLGIDLEHHPYTPDLLPLSSEGEGRGEGPDFSASSWPRFLFVGRFTEKKAPGDVIAAFARMREEWFRVPGSGFRVGEKTTPSGGAASLVMIGSGPLESALRGQVKALGLMDAISFPGVVPIDQLPAAMRGATALVLPSVTAPDGDCEGAPMVLMHAQAVGLPCITTWHSGNPEVLPGGQGLKSKVQGPKSKVISSESRVQSPESDGGQSQTLTPTLSLGRERGFVVAEHDVPGLAAAMMRMAQLSPGARRALQDAGRAWIAEHYDLRQTIDGYAALYQQLLDR
jgi:glycosyltransferase involved in cell wall biosynthesis